MRKRNESEVADNDHSGASDHSRNERFIEFAKDACRRAQADGEGLQSGGAGYSVGKRESEIERQEIDLEVTRVLETEFGVVHSGPIPDPRTFNGYPEAVRQKIIEWQDRKIKALFDDDSRRLDQITRADIKRKNTGQWLSFAINITLIVGVLLAFIETRSPNVFWAYTVLGATVVGNVIINFNRNKNDRESE